MSKLNPEVYLINPYNLLGLTTKSTIPELKKAYYQLALLCHPDKGGNKEDMHVVHQAYKYIKRQMENANYTKSYEDLEQEFKDFCQEQENIKPPSFMKIFEETNDFVREFNKRYEESVANCDIVDPFKDGYGHLMEDSVALNSHQSLQSLQSHPKLNYNDNDIDLEKPLNNKFSREIIAYEEPEYLPNTYGNFFRFDTKKVEDYSELQGDIQMTDYRLAFSPPEKVEGLDVDKADVNKLYEERLKEYQDHQNLVKGLCEPRIKKVQILTTEEKFIKKIENLF